MTLHVTSVARQCAVLLAAFLAVAALAPASAKPKTKVLGTDPADDAPPALDITSLAAGRMQNHLLIQIEINRMLPQIGGYPELPGIEWIFSTGTRTFLAEAFIQGTSPRFLLFELVDEGYEQLGDLAGNYSASTGFIEMHVPLKLIDARAGSKISGVEGPGGGDVDSHVHIGPVTHYADSMSTTKSFVVP